MLFATTAAAPKTLTQIAEADERDEVFDAMSAVVTADGDQGSFQITLLTCESHCKQQRLTRKTWLPSVPESLVLNPVFARVKMILVVFLKWSTMVNDKYAESR